MLIKISHSCVTLHIRSSLPDNSIFGVNNVSIFTVLGLSSSYRIRLSTNPSWVPRAIGFSCSKHFAVLEILISRFSLPHSAAPPSSEREILRWCGTRGISPLRFAWFPGLWRRDVRKMGADCGICANRSELCVLGQLLFASGILIHPLLYVFKI